MKGWQTKPLSEVCQIRPPKTEARNRLKEGDIVSFLPMEDLGVNQKAATATKTRPLGEVYGGYTYFSEGDVLLAKITPCFENGKLGIATNLKNGIGFGSSEYFVFRPSASIDREWLYYALSGEPFRKAGTASMGGAVGHQRVAKEFIESFALPVPPLAEQQRIVGVLDEAFAGLETLRANAEKNLQNARAVFESELDAIFERASRRWTTSKLGDLAAFRNGINYTKTSKGESVKVFGVKDFQDEFWAKLDDLAVVETNGRLSNDDTLREGDILFVRSNGNIDLIGRSVVIGSINERVTHSGFTIRARLLSRELSPVFLCRYLKSSRVRACMTGSGIGTNIKSLSQATLAPLDVPVPPLAEQRRTVTQLESLDEETQRLAALYEQKLDALDELKKSLLHEAFSGKL